MTKRSYVLLIRVGREWVADFESPDHETVIEERDSYIEEGYRSKDLRIDARQASRPSIAEIYQ